MIKKMISLLLVGCFFLTLCVPAFAGEESGNGEISQNLRWSFAANTLTISGTDSVIPDYDEGTAPWQEFAGNVFRLVLPATLERIGNFAFFGFANLKSVELPEHLASIGDFAFRDSGLESMEFPYHLKCLGTESFAGSMELESVKFNVLRSGGMGVSIIDGMEVIGNGAFAFCDNLQSVAFPETLQTIGDEAFLQCEHLSKVTFAQGGALEHIGAFAFFYCTRLKNMQLPKGISTIERFCFAGSGLESIRLEGNIQSVGEQAFANCDKLVRIDILNNGCMFYDDAFTTPENAKLYFIAAAKKVLAYAEKYAKPYEVLCIGRISHSAKSFKTTLTKASAKADGKVQYTCKSCGYSFKKKIAKIRSVKLNKRVFRYSGKVIMPSSIGVQVTDADGKVIPVSQYSVSRVSSTDGKKVGKHALKITFQGNYQGTFVRSYTIIPKGTSLKSVTAGKGSLKISWNKQREQCTGYQIRLCKNAKFKGSVKVITFRTNRTLSCTAKSLAHNTTYYIQVRTLKRTGGKNYYSAWSKFVGRKTK